MCITTKPRSRQPIDSRFAQDAAQFLNIGSLKRDNFSALPAPTTSASPAGKKRNIHYTVQHNYHDHSNDIREHYFEERPARGGVTTPFPLKLHDMLISVAAEGMEDIVSWQPHGRCFLVHKPKEFVELLPRYFKLSKLASFQRQLNLYGFQRLTRGQDRGGYYHEMFLRGRVFLSHSIQRIKVKGTGVRARSNPDQEPNFWAMPWVGEVNKKSPSEARFQVQSSFVVPTLPNMLFNTQAIPEPTPFPERLDSRKAEDDIVVAFGDKTFHYLDPVNNISSAGVLPNQYSSQYPKDAELDAFFEDFDFPDALGPELQDDLVFGNLLEQMIS